MPDYNLGPDDLCRTAITAMTRQLQNYFILYSMSDLKNLDHDETATKSLYPVLYAGSTSSLGQDETVSTLSLPTPYSTYTYIEHKLLGSLSLSHTARS